MQLKKTEENKEGNREFYKPTNVRAYGLQQSLCILKGNSTLNAPTGCLFNARQNQIGLKGKEMEKE